jgi:hypothetical protein
VRLSSQSSVRRRRENQGGKCESTTHLLDPQRNSDVGKSSSTWPLYPPLLALSSLRRYPLICHSRWSQHPPRERDQSVSLQFFIPFHLPWPLSLQRSRPPLHPHFLLRALAATTRLDYTMYVPARTTEQFEVFSERGGARFGDERTESPSVDAPGQATFKTCVAGRSDSRLWWSKGK